jgi:hypothetical protein
LEIYELNHQKASPLKNIHSQNNSYTSLPEIKQEHTPKKLHHDRKRKNKEKENRENGNLKKSPLITSSSPPNANCNSRPISRSPPHSVSRPPSRPISHPPKLQEKDPDFKTNIPTTTPQHFGNYEPVTTGYHSTKSLFSFILEKKIGSQNLSSTAFGNEKNDNILSVPPPVEDNKHSVTNISVIHIDTKNGVDIQTNDIAKENTNKNGLHCLFLFVYLFISFFILML